MQSCYLNIFFPFMVNGFECTKVEGCLSGRKTRCNFTLDHHTFCELQVIKCLSFYSKIELRFQWLEIRAIGFNR